MNLFQINKFAGAFLASILVIIVINMVGNLLIPGPGSGSPEADVVAEDSATLEVAVTASATDTAAPSSQEPAAAEPASDEPTLPILLNATSADEGRKSAKVCRSCHTFDQGGPNRLGPNLWGIVGAKIGGKEGFRYSKVLAGMEGEWGYAELFDFLADPRAFAPGTKMTQKVKKPEARAKVIVYLRSLSDNPLALPEIEIPKAPADAVPADVVPATMELEIPKSPTGEMPDNPELEVPPVPEIAAPEAAIEAPGDSEQPPTVYIE